MDRNLFLGLYRHMLTARKVDEVEEALAQRGEAFFFIPGSGHEAMAALEPHLTAEDWLHCHYRDKALALARGMTVESMFYALLGRAESNSAGRRMPGFPSDPELHLLNTPTLVGNSALQAVGVAMAVKNRKGNPVVLCSVGDGTTQQGEYLEAVGEAVRSNLPVLFVVEDNRYALSTLTGQNTFYSMPSGEADEFYGLKIHCIDGTDTVNTYEALGGLVAGMRKDRGPRLVIFKSERLSSHTNADDQTVYRSAKDIDDAMRNRDPIRILEKRLVQEGVSEDELKNIQTEVTATIQKALKTARAGTNPVPELGAKAPLPKDLEEAEEYRGTSDDAALSMLEAMRETLRHHLGADKKVSLYGEDIEDPKGDVFGLTRGLSSQFPEQVRNSPLAESTVLGVAVGRALAGEKPVAFLQFADFLPIAYNQIMSEMGAMYWRSKGDWHCPVIVMAICGAYRPGLGPYHAQNPESVVAHVPGVDVFAPSTAADAAGLLNAAFRSNRPTIFFYPKNLLNDRDVVTSPDVAAQIVPVGKARITRAGHDISIVTWGSTMPICKHVARTLAEEVGIAAEVVDLRSVFPWDKETILTSAKKTGKLLVVHEDNQTCGMGGEILATVAEESGSNVQVARVTRKDTYVPYDFASQIAVLPSYRSVLTRAAELLDLELEWEEPIRPEAGIVEIKAIGSSPSDETIRITELHVAEGDTVAEDALLVSVEADKAAMEISTPFAGTVDKLMVAEADVVTVGTPIIRVKTSEESIVRPITEEDPGRPILKKKYGQPQPVTPAPVSSAVNNFNVILSSVCSAHGSRVMTNEDFLSKFPEWTSADVLRRTGIEKRNWIGEGESSLTLGVDACRKLLKRENLDISDIDVLICSTGTPLQMTPSLACSILKELSPEKGEVMVQAYDVNAACTGFLYALQNAHDILMNAPDQKIVVVTSETLSQVLDHDDTGTVFLFGDAATASLITTRKRDGNVNARVFRPVLSAKGEDAGTLSVPFPHNDDYLRMDGQAVFRVAVRKLSDMMNQACAAVGVTINDLDVIVPHQANERILHAVGRMIKYPEDKIFINMRESGNTSSNTVPLGLEIVAPRCTTGDKIGMCAFGGGFTFGAGILELL
ncbi:MAG: beta-ketoacyl-ACP synthase 3 [Verrucomicrobia bacterium]|nr:beta-ketoacyl-ACP synthase 3 [Verrucomicrobiota bacterium]